ncbi:pyrimidine 5'-nucleotidase [Glaciimonas sp. PCH181]|uniref:pyrimidine 5'-nucleotidase n=1 Tax=Glaciimonas sp. PCH181 TaxID=2133943 RepID=UPI000D3921A5|nr:pyrimidine 5'-nucleotidase [Glaciimonas sp. PCH181]PUA18180.1 pyrimidine 5'-nucleotidase [Glaciimonas sp. PCH181]
MTNTTPLWLFDLDNTLHNASHAFFPAINENMNRFIARVLGVDGVDADAATVNAVRTDYWRRYGATLTGMVKHHAVRPEEFLREAHRFDDVAGMIRAERGLISLLKQLPGRKILLTNAPQRYSSQVMRHLGLHRQFQQHISIESMHVHRQPRPKPSPQFLRKLIARQGVAAHRCILVEDTLTNLKSAKRIGMRTVWVTGYLAESAKIQWPGQQLSRSNMTKRTRYVDVKVKSVRRLADKLHRLR